MKNTILILTAALGLTMSAHAGPWSAYDQNGNYYYGQYDSETGRGNLYDSNGGYRWTNDGNNMYDANGHYWYRSGNTWYQGN
jgi:hypothetical protein